MGMADNSCLKSEVVLASKTSSRQGKSPTISEIATCGLQLKNVATWQSMRNVEIPILCSSLAAVYI